MRGLVDSDDLPLNVSREILQHNRQIDTIRGASVKKSAGAAGRIGGKGCRRSTREFWDQFGQVLKEGPAEDFGNRERIAKLLRFASTHSDTAAQEVSLQDYIGRMQEGQEKIYYVTADTFAAAKSSPHLEIFRKKGIEVLLLHDRIDEWMISHLSEFDGKKLQSVAKGSLDLGALEDKEEKEQLEREADAHKDFIDRMRKALGDRIKDVRVSHRLTDSPSCLVVEEDDMALSLQKVLKQAGHDVPAVQPILEINPQHPLVVRLEQAGDEERFADWSSLLLEQATLAEGGQLEDPAAFVARLNQLLLTLAKE